jgi:hypothetical protein
MKFGIIPFAITLPFFFWALITLDLNTVEVLCSNR